MSRERQLSSPPVARSDGPPKPLSAGMTERARDAPRDRECGNARPDPIVPDLRGMGVSPDEHVRVSTRRGEIEIAARADADVSPGTVFIPFGKIPEFKYCAAKFKGPPLPCPLKQGGQLAVRWLHTATCPPYWSSIGVDIDPYYVL
jgi:hypothetical protein